MDGVETEIKCPRCQNDGCYNKFNYTTAEELTKCKHCGYYYLFTYLRDLEGNHIYNDITEIDTPTNYASIEIHCENPFGAYEVLLITGRIINGTIEDEIDYQSVIILFETIFKDLLAKFTISRLINGKIEVEVIYSKE